MSSLPTEWRTGIATNYGGPHDGDSPYSPSYGTSIGACGQCFEIQCVNSGGEFAGRCNGDGGESITIMVSDACPECEADHLDLQALTYNQLGPMELGRIDIKYRRVNCKPPVSMMVDVDSSSGEGGWIRMTVKNAAGRAAIKGVSLRGSGSGSWTELNNDWGARWETGQQPSGYPFDMMITQDDGQVVTCNGCMDKGTGAFQTSMQFKIVGSEDSASIVSKPAAGGWLWLTLISIRFVSTAVKPIPIGKPAPTALRQFIWIKPISESPTFLHIIFRRNKPIAILRIKSIP
ncbi:hypothetical protein WJX74_005149 [Apatococcus lobatus]|uniref:Expansin-like EG45 domain-containing protein n=1 Tax=Apatococcus lobatus TaxID=904363 RepID=A0AAW1RWK3_9CHLO